MDYFKAKEYATKGTDPVKLEAILKESTSGYLTAAICSNPCTPARILEAYATNPSVTIRESVASNPKTPLKTLRHLATHQDYRSVPRAAIMNPSFTDDEKIRLIGSSVFFDSVLAMVPSLSPTVISELLHRGSLAAFDLRRLTQAELITDGQIAFIISELDPDYRSARQALTHPNAGVKAFAAALKSNRVIADMANSIILNREDPEDS